MKGLKKLPIYYQNSEVSVEKEKKTETKEQRNFVSIPFYQSDCHQPGIHYKPISKIWKPEK